MDKMGTLERARTLRNDNGDWTDKYLGRIRVNHNIYKIEDIAGTTCGIKNGVCVVCMI